MEVSRVSTKGQVVIPKSIREKLQIHEGDKVAFIEEDGKVLFTKASLKAFRELAEELSRVTEEKGYTEEEIMKSLKETRKELLDERKLISRPR
ncbi:AbrB/MazE/SpoVT family DNA-binding domain-containing protein [Kroppenstedtia sanguinis]|uniref:AbrB/MazE/SpoVT family DNA-binding domain-containing protein n=1 Tax=Kroppenstedtia sanguinis TaxID=1380684 RepID=A0ABW4C7M7_9BACL